MKDDTRKKEYTKPKLTMYGQISKLTTGGSGMRQEMIMMGMQSMGPNRFP